MIGLSDLLIPRTALFLFPIAFSNQFCIVSVDGSAGPNEKAD